jgi:DNA replication protein DnaC
MTDYKKKYLKYKSKYLSIQKKYIASGGGIQDIRRNLIDYFYQIINKRPFHFNIDVKEPSEILKIANTPYNKRPDQFNRGIGLFYTSDYNNIFSHIDDHSHLSRITNNKFWNSLTAFNIFDINDLILPSDAIRAWFNGPTITECSGVMQAVFYMHILNMYGDELFNKRFGKIVSQFIITNNLFSPLLNVSKKITSEGGIMGNPLFFLFDIIKTAEVSPYLVDHQIKFETHPLSSSLEDLKNGDVVYIKGVKDYELKHTDGAAIGWNLICVEQLDGTKKFIGFGPNEFINGPLTIEQLRQLFIDEYNKPQSSAAKSKIQKFMSPDYIVTDDALTQRNKSLSIIAKSQEHNMVPPTTQIIGLQVIMRLNTHKLDTFMKQDPISWENQDLSVLTKTLDVKKYKKIRHVIPFSVETYTKTFENYEVDNPQRQNILDLVKRFAFDVSSNNKRSFPSGCILTGTAGIGKTHLSVATAKFVSNYNKNVLYVDSAYFSETYQRTMYLHPPKEFDLDKTLEGTRNMFNTPELLNGIDLVILDDINSEYGVASQFLKDAIKYIYENNKSILITSNVPIKGLYGYIPHYIGYDDPFSDNFIVKYYNMESFRKSWIDDCFGLDKLDILAKYKADQAAGVIIEDTQNMNPDGDKPYNNTIKFKEYIDNRNINIKQKLKKYSMLFQEKITDTTIKLKIVDSAAKYVQNQHGYYGGVVNDKYVHGIEAYNIVLIYVSEQSEMSNGQLLQLITKAHDHKIKIIVVTDSIIEFKKLIIKEINGDDKNKQRLTDRFRIIFPTIID